MTLAVVPQPRLLRSFPIAARPAGAQIAGTPRIGDGLAPYEYALGAAVREPTLTPLSASRP